MSDTTRIDTADVLAIDAAVARSTGSDQFGITQSGFVPKPFARLLAEKLALAQELFGNDIDLTSGSTIRKLLEVSALEDTRTWAALASMYDNTFVVSATGDALSRLGEELGIPRPYLEAKGTITLRLQGELPAGATQLTIPRGARLLTAGGHHVAMDETLVLSATSPERKAAIFAFYPGPEHNLDPTVAAVDGSFPQRIDRWHPLDPNLRELFVAEAAADTPLVTIEHTESLVGGELQWSDTRYRELLLRAPRSLWTVEAIEIAVSLVPGVRQVQVRDAWGGLDLSQSIFGNFNFIERLFSADRDVGSPYYFTVLIAPTSGAIWDGPDGLRVAVESAIEDLRPISIFPQVKEAEEVGVGIAAGLVVKGIPLPSGSPATINSSQQARALKARLLNRIRRYVDQLQFGEPVRWSEVMWALMSEPGIADVQNLKLLRYPSSFDDVDFGTGPVSTAAQEFDCGKNVKLQTAQVPVFVDDDTRLRII